VASIQDAGHEAGNPHFFWLPPMVKNPSTSGDFDATLAPVVTVCAWTDTGCDSPLIATFTTTSGPGDQTVGVDADGQHYSVQLHTRDLGLEEGTTYRIRVTVEGLVLGHADIQVFLNQGAAKNTDTGSDITLVDGQTLPVKFRIEQDALAYVGPEGGRVTLAAGAVDLDVPAGALGGFVRPTARAASVPDGVGILDGTAWDLGPDGLTFGLPVTLGLHYDGSALPSGVYATDLVVLGETDGGLFGMRPSASSAAQGVVSAGIDETGIYGAAPAASAVAVVPETVTLESGGTQQLTAEVTAGGEPAADRVVTWSSDAENVATVSASGLVTAADDGTATITASSGGAAGTAAVTVRAASTGPSCDVQITSEGHEQRTPAIDGDRIVWTDTRDGNDNVYLYDVSTGTESRFTGSAANDFRPAVSGDRVVWQRGNNIYMRSVSASATTQITDAGSASVPEISGNRLVYMDHRNATFGQQVFVYNLLTRTEARINPHDVNNEYFPDVDGDHIVWSDPRNGNEDVFLYDLSTGVETRITTDGANQDHPRVSGSRIVWQDDRNGCCDIYMYDLASGSETRITGSPTARREGELAIDGDRIVWSDIRNGDDDIYMYDTTTGAETRITDSPRDELHPDVSGSRIVWQDYRNGNWDIYMCDLGGG